MPTPRASTISIRRRSIATTGARKSSAGPSPRCRANRFTSPPKAWRRRTAPCGPASKNPSARLGVDHIDFFHIWCLLRPGQLKERLERRSDSRGPVRAREEGLIKHLVVSTHLGGDDNADVLASGLFEGITIGYNALNFPFRGKTLEAARGTMTSVSSP
jgi:hypothetical protein